MTTGDDQHPDGATPPPPAASPPPATPATPPPTASPPPAYPPTAYPPATPTPPPPPAYPPPGPSAAPYVPSQFPNPAVGYGPPPGAPTEPPAPLPPYGGAPPFGAPPTGPSAPFYSPPPGAPGGAPPSHQGRVVFAIVSVFALLLAGGFAVWSLTRPDGAADPEQAVRNLFTAIDNEDAVGVMETLPPSERSIIRDAVLDSISNLQRLGVLSDFDAHKVPGATFEVENLQLSSSQLSSDVVAVTVTGGTITATTNPSEVPVGDLLRDKVKDDLAKAKPETDTEDLARSHLRLAAVHEQGGWHVSLFYSIAEAARGNHAPPLFGQGPTPLGADTPDGAVREMVRAATDLDPELAIRMLPPDEMRVMYDYSTIFLDDAKRAAADARDDGYHAKVDRLDLRTEGDGDTRRVFVNNFDITGGDQYSEYRVTYDGQCYHATETVLQKRQYSSRTPDDGELCRDGTIRTNGTTQNRSSTASQPFSGLGSASADVGITVVQVNGRWYLSPTRTLVDNLLTGLHSIKREDLQKLLDSDLFNSSQDFSSSSPSFGTVPRTVPREPGTTLPATRNTPGTSARRSPTTTVDPLCEDDPTAFECDDIEPPPSSSTTRRSTTTTDPDAADGQGGSPNGG